jgi:hypothetical protein
MRKYKISREFFPFSHFTPPISEKFLAMAVPHMKTPKSIFKDNELDVSRYEIKSYDGESIECFLMSAKSLRDNARASSAFTAADSCLLRQGDNK